MAEPLPTEPPFEIILLPPGPVEGPRPPAERTAPAPAPASPAASGPRRRASWISITQALVILALPTALALVMGLAFSARGGRTRSEPVSALVPAPIPAAVPAAAPAAMPGAGPAVAPAAVPAKPAEPVREAVAAPARSPRTSPPALAPVSVAEGPTPVASRPQGVPPAPAVAAVIHEGLSPGGGEEDRDLPEPAPAAESRRTVIPVRPVAAVTAKAAPVERDPALEEVLPAPEPPRRDPRELEAEGLLAEARALGTDQPALGAARYRKVIELLPARTELWKAAADLDLGRGALDDAAREYGEYLRTHPGRADVLQNLAIIHVRGGRREEARACLEAALQSAPSADLYFNLGNLHLAAGTPGAAAAAYRRALQYEPSHPEAKFNLAIALERAGQRGEAVGALADLGSVSPEIVRERARLEAMMGGVEGERAWEAARSSRDADLVTSVATGFRRVGELEKALALFDRAIELSPLQAAGFVNRGALRQTMGRLVEAAADYQEAGRLNPSLPEARFNLGVLEEERGQYVAALGHYREALHGNPKYPAALNNIGALYLRVGQPDRAIECFRQCLDADAAYHTARINLAWAYLAAGARDQARDELARYVSLVPKTERNPEAVRVLNELGGPRAGGDARP